MKGLLGAFGASWAMSRFINHSKCLLLIPKLLLSFKSSRTVTPVSGWRRPRGLFTLSSIESTWAVSAIIDPIGNGYFLDMVSNVEYVAFSFFNSLIQ